MKPLSSFEEMAGKTIKRVVEFGGQKQHFFVFTDETYAVVTGKKDPYEDEYYPVIEEDDSNISSWCLFSHGLITKREHESNLRKQRRVFR